MLVLLLAACNHYGIEGCPGEITDIAADDPAGPYGTPRQWADNWNGILVSAGGVFGDGVLEVSGGSASAVNVDHSACQGIDHTQLTAPVVLRFDSLQFTGILFEDGWSDPPALNTGTSDTLLLEWMQAEVLNDHPSAGTAVEAAASWYLDDGRLSMTAYMESSSGVSEYNRFEVSVFDRTFSWSAP